MSQERIDAALDVILRYGGTDGAHHKQWVLDQVVRALTGTPAPRARAAKTSAEYREWRKRYEDGGEYEWDPGTPP